MKNPNRKSSAPAIIIAVLLFLLLLGGGVGVIGWSIARYETARRQQMVDEMKRFEAAAAENARRAMQQAVAEMEAAEAAKLNADAAANESAETVEN